jgi:hypothetical protein
MCKTIKMVQELSLCCEDGPSQKCIIHLGLAKDKEVIHWLDTIHLYNHFQNRCAV